MHQTETDRADCDLGVGDAYYNQGSVGGADGPVYEEILSNRNSDAQHYEDFKRRFQ